VLALDDLSAVSYPNPPSPAAKFLQDFLGDGVLTGLNRRYEKKADPVLPRSAAPRVPHD